MRKAVGVFITILGVLIIGPTSPFFAPATAFYRLVLPEPTNSRSEALRLSVPEHGGTFSVGYAGSSGHGASPRSTASIPEPNPAEPRGTDPGVFAALHGGPGSRALMPVDVALVVTSAEAHDASGLSEMSAIWSGFHVTARIAGASSLAHSTRTSDGTSEGTSDGSNPHGMPAPGMQMPGGISGAVPSPHAGRPGPKPVVLTPSAGMTIDLRAAAAGLAAEALVGRTSSVEIHQATTPPSFGLILQPVSITAEFAPIAAVPQPAGLTLLLVACAAMAMTRRIRRR